LLAAVLQAEPFETALHGAATFRHVVNPCDEIEILADAQVFVVTETLRHVANVSFDLGLLRAQIKAQARAAARVRREQTAEHPDESGFA
jgi:hypothetical protein